MPRGLSSDQRAALSARIVHPAYFMALHLDSGTVRFWTGTGEVSALGATWYGTGEFGAVDGIESERGIVAASLSLSLVGLPADLVPGGLVSDLRAEEYQFRPLTVYFSALSPSTGAIVADPVPVWEGFADVLSLRNGNTVSISLSAEPLSSLWRRANGRRMTTESHNQALGNPATRDLFFEPTSRLMGRPKPLLKG